MTKQSELWRGKFGDDYHARNKPSDRVPYWSDVFDIFALSDPLATCNIQSVCELGAGQGDNLIALRELLEPSLLVGVEINESACEEMARRGLTAINCAVGDLSEVGQFDLVLTRGFLMHVPDEDVAPTLRKIYQMSKRFICIGEYYSPVRRQVKYHGQDDALWIDDFAGWLLEQYSDLKLIRYTFHYDRDNGGNDVTYFLLEKTK